MLWHRQAIFESKGAKLSSSAECRIRTQGLWNRFSNRLWIPAGKVTELYCDLSNCALAAENANSNRRNILFGSTLIWAAYLWLNDNIALHTGSQPSTRLHHLALDIKIEIKFIWLAGNVSLLLWHHNHQINWSRKTLQSRSLTLSPKHPCWPFDLDFHQIDVSVPLYTRWWVMSMAMVITTITIIIYSTPIFTAVIVPLLILYAVVQVTLYRVDSKFAPSQWETVLLCHDVSHWLGANLELTQLYIDDLVRECYNSNALAMELLQSCAKPSIWAS